MKKTKEILGLSLICINEGSEYGKIKGLLVNPDKGKVEYLIIDDGKYYLGAKLLAFDKVLGIGIDAVTTENEINIKSFSDVDEALDLAAREVSIIGTKVYTKKGSYIGTVEEYYINEEDGFIIGCQIAETEEKSIIPASSIITFGKSVLVVVENAKDTLVSSLDEVEMKPKDKKNEAQDSPSAKETDNEKEASTADEKPSGGNGKASKVFEEKQREFLLGRKASKSIISDSGQVLIDEGQLITEEAIDRIKAEGKIIELTMNTKS